MRIKLLLTALALAALGLFSSARRPAAGLTRLAQQAIRAQYGKRLKQLDRDNDYFSVINILFYSAREKDIAGQKQKIVDVGYRLKYIQDWYDPDWRTAQSRPLHKEGDEVPAEAEVIFVTTDQGQWQVISVTIKDG